MSPEAAVKLLKKGVKLEYQFNADNDIWMGVFLSSPIHVLLENELRVKTEELNHTARQVKFKNIRKKDKLLFI